MTDKRQRQRQKYYTFTLVLSNGVRIQRRVLAINADGSLSRLADLVRQEKLIPKGEYIARMYGDEPILKNDKARKDKLKHKQAMKDYHKRKREEAYVWYDGTTRMEGPRPSKDDK